jgi:EAL domain-containing protein (putative c-di-GMP-specific phosphodiesterase class I)
MERMDGDDRDSLRLGPAQMRLAFRDRQFFLCYQPVVELTSRRIVGFEALMRWRHPRLGLIPPDTFIPIAESNGMILTLGRWALRVAAMQLAEWHQRFPRAEPLSMSVNVSPRQFAEDDIVGLVRHALEEFDVPSRSLRIEITETMMMSEPQRCLEVMRRLRGMGVHLSIDDFGTGYSSLAYLHQIPADTLKIDRSFISAIVTGERRAAIVEVVTTLARILGMETVAEGVEEETEAAFLNGIDCTYAQGFLFAPPMVPAEATSLLEREASAVPQAETPCTVRMSAD